MRYQAFFAGSWAILASMFLAVILAEELNHSAMFMTLISVPIYVAYFAIYAWATRSNNGENNDKSKGS